MKTQLLLIVSFSSFIIIRSAALNYTLNNVNANIKLQRVEEMYKLMDLLAIQYTPNCLRVYISEKTYSIPKYDEKYMQNLGWSSHYTDSFKYTTHMTLLYTNETKIHIMNILNYVNQNTEKVSPYSCVTYLLSEAPDEFLLPLLTDIFSSKKLTRYFVVHQSSNDVYDLLLDERLSKEENVVAITHHQSNEINNTGNSLHNNKISNNAVNQLNNDRGTSYWRVLIRQLLHPSKIPQVLVVNKWSINTGLDNNINIFPKQMNNFYGTKLIGVIMPFVPFNDLEEIEGSLIWNHKPSVDRFLLEAIAKTLNFTYVVVKPPDGQWGYIKDDGHYAGVVGEVEFGRANFSLCLSITIERMKAVDFTGVYYVEPMTFITAKSRPNPPWRKLITPFRGNVWIVVVLSVCCCAILYQALFWVQGYFTQFHNDKTSSPAMHILASFLSQSLHRYLWIIAGRVFLGFWLLYAFLVTTYYKTSLTSALAVPFTPSTIDTLQQLLNSGLNYGMNTAKGVGYALFSTSEVPIYKKMFGEITLHSTTENIRLVAEGKYSYVYFKSHLEMLVAVYNNDPKRKTDLYLAPEQFFPTGYGWAVPKGAPYQQSFDRVMKHCVRAGLIDKWIRDFHAIYLKKPQGQNSEESPDENGQLQNTSTGVVVLNLNHLQGPFLMLFLGYGTAIVVILVELLIATLWNIPKI